MSSALAAQIPVEHGVNLRTLNSFGLPAVAPLLVRIDTDMYIFCFVYT